MEKEKPKKMLLNRKVGMDAVTDNSIDLENKETHL